jgi:hypothetical protein
MKRAGHLSIAFLIYACSSGGPPGGTTPAGATSAAGQASASATQAAGGGGSLLDNAKAAAQHACGLLPTDLVSGIIDTPTPPQEELYPPRCSVFGTKTAMAFSLDVYNPLGDPPSGATTISGVGTGAYLEKLSAGNFSLWVGLSPEGGVLFVEVNNSDGQDHTDQAVNLAKAILQKLGG